MAHGRSVAVRGPAGIGKTTLVRSALADHEVAEGVAVAGLQWKRYLPLSIALGSDLRGDAEAVASEAARRLADRVLFIDDLHVADTGTVEVVGLLAGRVRLVATMRPNIAAPTWAATVIELGALPASVCHALGRSWHPDLSAEEHRRLMSLAGGNPLLLRFLVAGGVANPTLRAAAVARLEQVAPEVAEAITELALFGRPLATDRVGVPAERLPSDLVVHDGDTVGLAHALLADASLDRLGPAEIAAARRRLASRLTPADAADQYLWAGDLASAAEAARQAIDSDPDPTSRAHLLGVQATATSDDHLRVAAAAALVTVGDWGGAAQQASAVGSEDPILAATAALHLARSRWFATDVPGAAEAVEAGLEHVRGTSDSIEARLLVERAHQHVRVQEASGSTAAIAEEALAAAIRAGVDVPRARLVLATALAHDGVAGWEELFHEVIAEAAAADDIESECSATFFLASRLGFGGRARDAIELMAPMVERAAAAGQLTWKTHLEGALLTDRFQIGTESRLLASEAHEFIATNPMFRNRAQAELVRALCLADDDRAEDAREHLDAARRAAASADDRSILVTAATEVEWLAGDLDACCERTAEATAGGAGWFGIANGAVAAAAFARFERNDRTVAAFLGSRMPFFAAFGLEIEGLNQWASGDLRGAIATLDRAAVAWLGLGGVRYQLRAGWAAGEMARRLGDPSARRRLTAVTTSARPLRMLALVRRGEAALASIDGGPALTDRERSVMLLISDGLTSVATAERLGIAKTTVETHVASAMRKLGAATRRQAVAEFARRRR